MLIMKNFVHDIRHMNPPAKESRKKNSAECHMQFYGILFDDKPRQPSKKICSVISEWINVYVKQQLKEYGLDGAYFTVNPVPKENSFYVKTTYNGSDEKFFREFNELLLHDLGTGKFSDSQPVRLSGEKKITFSYYKITG